MRMQLRKKPPGAAERSSMGLFGRKKAVEWDMSRSSSSRVAMQHLFEEAVPDYGGFKLLYGYNTDVRNMAYAGGAGPFSFRSMIIGYREGDMSLVIVDTVPDFSVHGEVQRFTRDSIRGTKIHSMTGAYTIFRRGGINAGYVDFVIPEGSAGSESLAYILQEEALPGWKEFWRDFAG